MAHHPTEDSNTSANEHRSDIRARAQISRRPLIPGGLGLTAASSLPMLAACGRGDDVVEKKLGFAAVGKSLADSVVLPTGYIFTILHAAGDRLVSSTPAYSHTGAETDDWSQRVGDHHDGMEIFYIGANGKYTNKDTGRTVLAVNHESSADAHFFHPKGQTSGGVSGKKFTQFGDGDLGGRPRLAVVSQQVVHPR